MSAPIPFDTIVSTLKDNDVVSAGVFGSYVRGEHKEGSDLDMLVKFKKPKGLFDFVALEKKLSEILKVKVDLVTEQSVSPYIRDSIFRDLKIFYGER